MANWRIEQSDCIAFLESLADGEADLCFCSPPYQRARSYLENGEDLGIARDAEEWVSWMVKVCTAARRACKGLCAFVVEGQTKDYRYSATPLLLAADLHLAGFHLRKPPIFRRVGIPGSGGPDWLRSDYEPIICFARGGKLPWSDATAMGHPPKWAPGGEMSNRLKDGQRVNQWGPIGSVRGAGNGAANTERRKRGRPSHEEIVVGEPDATPGLFGDDEPADESGYRDANGNRKAAVPKFGSSEAVGGSKARKMMSRRRGGSDVRATESDGHYSPPVLANPGNVIQQRYTAEQVAEMMGEPSDVVDCQVGGGLMGNSLSHLNEAPFPEDLVEFFVRSFCPPGGLVIDPFAGSGTTLSVAVSCGRKAYGCDLRQSQVDLTLKRLAGVTPTLFPEA